MEAADENGGRWARIAPTMFPVGENGETRGVHKVMAYDRSALWDRVKAWCEGGAACGAGPEGVAQPVNMASPANTPASAAAAAPRFFIC